MRNAMFAGIHDYDTLAYTECDDLAFVLQFVAFRGGSAKNAFSQVLAIWRPAHSVGTVEIKAPRTSLAFYFFGLIKGNREPASAPPPFQFKG